MLSYEDVFFLRFTKDEIAIKQKIAATAPPTINGLDLAKDIALSKKIKNGLVPVSESSGLDEALSLGAGCASGSMIFTASVGLFAMFLASSRIA